MRRPLRPLSARRPRRAQISAEQLGALSHEFRTPLNGVLGMARLLESTNLSAEQRAYAAAIRDSGEHLLTLVNDVLDFAKLGASKVELHPDEINIEDALRGVAELMSPRAREKGLEIAWAAEVGGKIMADEGRLRQVLLNFAGNAVKFTEAGGVIIGCSQGARGRLRLAVEDTGPGVSEAMREHIFEAFAQADPAHEKLGGTGLGLAIARRLALSMNGEVGVEPRVGGGSCFWLEAPFATLETTGDTTPLMGRTVGIASHNPMVREAAARQIRICGGEAAMAHDVEGLASVTHPGDVVLVDHGLADAGRLVRRPAGRKAIILLAPEDRALIARYRRSGFEGYLIKPLRRASLAERVLIAAGAPAANPALDDDRIAAAVAPGKRVLLVEDNPINALLARALLTREGCEIDHAAGGEEAIAAVKVGAYDLILMDMRMPGLSGVETALALRKAGLKTPIVALTANAFEEDRHACLAAGMDDFLVKPMSPDALRSVLTRWAGRRPAARAATRPARQARA